MVELVVRLGERALVHAEGVEQALRILFREELEVQVEDVRRLFDQAQVPVRLEGAELRPPQVAELALLGLAGPLQDLGDRGMVLVRVSIGPPRRHPFGEPFVQSLHLA